MQCSRGIVWKVDNFQQYSFHSTHAYVSCHRNLTPQQPHHDGRHHRQQPPLPLEHPHFDPLAPSNHCAKNESNFFDDLFIFETKHPGTQGYGATAVAPSNGCYKNNHDPQLQLHQSQTYLSLAPPPSRYNLNQLLDDIRSMCKGFVMPKHVQPPRSNDNTATTTTATMIADIRQTIAPTACSNPTVCSIPLFNATITSTNKEPTLTTTKMTIPTTISNGNDDDATTTTTITIDDDVDDATMTAPTTITLTDDDDTMTTTPATDHPIHATTICTPWLRDSFSLVHQAIDCLADAITDMSSATAEMSASLSNKKFSNLNTNSPMPPRRLTTPPKQFIPLMMELPPSTSQPHPLGPPSRVHADASCYHFPLPIPLLPVNSP